MTFCKEHSIAIHSYRTKTKHPVISLFYSIKKHLFLVPDVTLTNLQWAYFSLDAVEEWKTVSKLDWFVAVVELRKLGRAPGMLTKPSHRLARHSRWLSLGDNWLSIRDEDNNMRVSRRAVNHYLSVRQPWLHTVSSSFPLLCVSIFSHLQGSLWSKKAPAWYSLHVRNHLPLFMRPFFPVITSNQSLTRCHCLTRRSGKFPTYPTLTDVFWTNLSSDEIGACL